MIIRINRWLITYNLVLVILIPVLLAIHGYLYVVNGTSSAAVIYGIKYSGIIVVLPLVLQFGFSPLLVKRNLPYLFYCSAILLSGLLMPSFFSHQINWFYYFADFIGISLTIITFFYTYYLLSKQYVQPFQIFEILLRSLFLISLIIIWYYNFSKGMKVSTSPEIHYSLALFFCIFTIRYKYNPSRTLLFLPIVLFAVIVSQYRINLFITFGVIAGSLFWTILVRHEIFNYNSLVIIVAIALFLFFGNPEIITERLESIQLSEKVGKNNSELFSDNSLNQRFLEANLIFKELSNLEWPVWIFGKGFGAEYFNHNKLIQHYPDWKHSSHITITSLLLRNGLLGVALYLFVVGGIIRSVWKKNKELFIATVGLIFTYFAQLTDQYVYWGVIFGISISVWLFLLRASKSSQNRRLKYNSSTLVN